MKLAFLSYHAPRAEGSAAGRQLFAVGTALREEGHEVSALCWQTDRPADLPVWAQWRPLPAEARWLTRGRALRRPRSDVVRLGWQPPDDAVVVSDEPTCFAGVAGHPGAVSTVHFSVREDRAALHDWSPHHLQDLRAERYAVRAADRVWTFSERVRGAIGRGTCVPATVPMPATPVDPVDAPVVGLLADWSWKPNLVAADHLVRGWHQVRDAVPGAQLLLAGRGQNPVGSLAGVSWLGTVTSTSDLLSRLAVFGFPCPPTSGPKMKTLDALAHGVPVVTTAAGVEGVLDTSGAVVTDPDRLADALAAVLGGPGRRADLAARARAGMLAQHAPVVAARARLAALGVSAG